MKAVTAPHYKGMKPLRKIVREYLDQRGVWMHELECGHTLVAPNEERPFSRRCPFCKRSEST